MLLAAGAEADWADKEGEAPLYWHADLFSVMACVVMAYIPVACIVVACVVMAYVVMAHIVMAWRRRPQWTGPARRAALLAHALVA